jgi:hypothetical protein
MRCTSGAQRRRRSRCAGAPPCCARRIAGSSTSRDVPAFLVLPPIAAPRSYAAMPDRWVRWCGSWPWSGASMRGLPMTGSSLPSGVLGCQGQSHRSPHVWCGRLRTS